MSTQDGPQPAGPMEPLLSGVTDGVATGYKALELVIEGLRESIRLHAVSARPQAARPERPGAAFGSTTPPGLSSPPTRGGKSPAGLVQDLAGIVTDALGATSTVVQDISQAIGEQSHGAVDQARQATLILSAPAGGTGTTSLTVWNTGPSLLREVKLSSTDLIGASSQILASAVTFGPGSITQIAPRKGEEIKISVAVPSDTRPGLCRGVVVATPGDACALIELTVTAASAQVAVEPTTSDQPAGSADLDAP